MTASAVALHSSPSVALKVTTPSHSPSPEPPALAPGVSETLLAAFSEPASKTAGDALTPGMDDTLASQAREKPSVDVIPEVSVQDEVDYKMTNLRLYSLVKAQTAASAVQRVTITATVLLSEDGRPWRG